MPRLTAVLFGLMLMLCGSTLMAQSTSGTLATTDDSFTHPGSPMVGSAGGPRRYRAIEFDVTTTGNYTFNYNPTGYNGALYLYQGSFQPGSPGTNRWTHGDTGSPNVSVVHNLSVPGKFVVVLTSTANNASGSWTLNITGPGTLDMGPVVNSCAPTSGSTGGGTNATLTGSFFTGVNNVTFGGTAVTNLTVVNDTTITCTTPSHAAGSVTIRASKPAGFGLAGERFNSFTYNLTPTSVSSINRQTPSGTTTNASSVVFRVTFAASAGGLTSSNFDTTTTGSVAGESVASVSGSGTIWDVTVNTGTGDGTIRLDMINDNGVNPSLTNVPFTSGQTYTIDKTAPVVSSIVRAAANPSNATSVTFTVTFSESVSGVATGNFSVDATGPSGASITGISGTGATRTVTVNTGTGDGTLSIDLLNNLNNIADTAGNTMSSAFVSGEAYTIDKTAPGVSIGAPSVSSTSTGPVSYTITYAGADTVTLTGGNVTLNTTGTATGSVAVSGSGTATRTVTISSITGDGTIGISIAANTASDAAGNQAGAAGPSTTFAVSGLPGISIGAPSATLVSGGPVDFVVTYTNATAVSLASGDVTLNTTGTVAGSVAVTGTGTATRTVTVSSITGDGSFTISIAANTASNGAGDAPAAGPSASVDVDNTDPGLTPGGTVTVSQGTTSTGASVGTVSDNMTAAGNLGVTATSVPTGLVVNNITNTAGTVTADIEALGSATTGTHVVEFTVTDDAGNSSVANLDVDVTGNQAPTISGIADQTINMNADTGALAITVGDVEDAPGTLTLSATTDNSILIDVGTDFLFGGSGASRTLTVTPQNNNVGVATITVTVTDSATASTSTTFVLTVTDSTDAPAIAPIANITITRDQTSAVFDFTATDPQGDGTLGAPAADSDNTTLIQGGDFTFGGTAPNLTFQITPQPGETGTAVVTISISDGTHTASRAFTVLVQDPPSNGGGGGDDDDDEDCTTGTGSSTWMMLLALVAALGVALRSRRTV